MANVFDIHDWEAKPWYNTGGTRAKKYIESPDGKYYYFKRSEYKTARNGKPEKDYRYEFWSEIISYEVGKLLGFDVLEYNIALDGKVVGCICEDMIDSGKEELIGGVQYLQGVDHSFDPGEKEFRKKYTFQLIESALKEYGLEHFLKKIVEMIVFDTIIGNSDRHQENWAIITEHTTLVKAIKRFDKLFISDEEERKVFHDAKLLLSNKERFAPLFDNGSSLGRELTEQRVDGLLRNENELSSYIIKGKAEIHWNEKKLFHFQLLEKMLETSYREILLEYIERTRNHFNADTLQQIVRNVDESLPRSHEGYSLPLKRKELITKLLTLRAQKLFEYLS
ncbi:MAG TPA: hypothetical protein PL009_05295 [Flavipsychrobacter sp.]|nr:hypothetical protein [Flavipsychrobacter sp.]